MEDPSSCQNQGTFVGIILEMSSRRGAWGRLWSDNLLPERDEARPPAGPHLAGTGAGGGDPGPLLGDPFAGEPPRLSVRGPEGEDGGDAGALLIEKMLC